jgi:hypothetical protein
MQARQAADDPEAYCRKLSERVRPETDTDIQAAVLERIDGIIAQISRVSKIG